MTAFRSDPWDVACPHCKASAGRACKRYKGKEPLLYARINHLRRVRAWRTWQTLERLGGQL